MAESPHWKVYDSQGQYEAACKHVEIAAGIASILGDGTTVRYGHRMIVWTEGQEEFSAGQSYDGAGAIMLERMNKGRRD